MTECAHKNFAIDVLVDKQYSACFEEMVQYQMRKLEGTELSEEIKRQMATALVFEKKEELKLNKKRKAAKKLLKKEVKWERREHRWDSKESLLKRCLMKQHRKKRSRIANEETDVYIETKRARLE